MLPLHPHPGTGNTRVLLPTKMGGSQPHQLQRKLQLFKCVEEPGPAKQAASRMAEQFTSWLPGCQDAGHPSSQPSVRYAHCSCHGTVPPSLWFLFLAFCMSSLLLYFLFAKDEVHRGLCGYTGGIANQLAIASLRCQCYSMVLCSF